ncbi:MAG: hypothetical protein RBU30_13930 [Polyangia bacterium]|jgi:putative GTP pyrophosphokinase|nr:hypothetical protein [Polyangia bacterium]
MYQAPPAPDQLQSFLEAYARYVRRILQPTQTEIQSLLQAWQVPEYWVKYKRTHSIPIPTPIRSTMSRIKRPEQVVDKIFRKPKNFPAGLHPKSFQAMNDAIGVRMIVYFLSHLPLIDRELRSSDVVEIVEDDPPMAYMTAHQARSLGLEHLSQEVKESGYRSVHYNLRLTRSRLPPAERPVFELQVRSATMDLWSALEHHLGYKPGRRAHSAAKTQLRILSNNLAAVDEHFNFLYEELSRYQEQSSFETEAPLTPETLPAVLSEVGITCAQRDINNIIKFLLSRGVETGKDLFELATPRRLEILRNTYLSALGRLPVSLEIIATLAALGGAADEAEETQRIKLQIAYRGAWDVIRQEFAGKENEE